MANRASAVIVLCALGALSSPAQTFTTLASFSGTNGANPHAGLMQVTDGDLYGTTKLGGAQFRGSVFKITASGTLTTLHSFCSLALCSDGANPYAPLVQAANGDLYGTTAAGGMCAEGTVFKISLHGALTTLYCFCSLANCADGSVPYAGLVQATDGDLYGTTLSDGAHSGGTVFRITPAGTLTTLYSFCSLANCADGEGPQAGLLEASNRELYGTTARGGANLGGTIFQIAPSGTLTTLYTFCSLANCSDGELPYGTLMQAADGELYGTTSGGGADGAGTVFRITPSGTLTTLYSFCSLEHCADGRDPHAGLIQATDGNLYGATVAGGTNVGGTLFQITPSGTLTTLYRFCSQGYPCPDGKYPAGLVQATNGNLYGTTIDGGANLAGTVFGLSLGLAPFVESLPTAGKVGSRAKILGTDLTGATSVTFNSSVATFKVASATLITATVPAGATTGTIQVVTPSGTLSSNVPFRILK